MTDWNRIHKLQSQADYWKGKLNYRRQKLAGWIISGKRAHYWHDNKAIERARREIRKWQKLAGEADYRIHILDSQIHSLEPKQQEWPMGGWVRPGEPCWKQRNDQGNDFELLLYHSVVAPASGYCVEWAADRPFPNGFGDPYAVVYINDGPFGHNSWYLGHANEPLIRPGQHFAAEQPLARLNHSLNTGRGWIELGHWSNGPGPMGEGNNWAHLFGPVYK